MGHRSAGGRGLPIHAVAVIAVLAMLSFAPTVTAGVLNSPHDFFTTYAASALNPQEGVCAPCHRPHFSTSTIGIWRRSLTQETTFFGGSNVPSGQNYAAGDTLACYDCHDNHSSVDNDPDGMLFSTPPQDVAFDDDMKTTAVGSWDGTGSSQPVGAKFGYFEDRYSGVSIFRRGGHYFKSADPDGGGALKALDKLPCGDCHDPHDTSNEVFIKKGLAGGNWTGLTASPKTRVGGSGNNGREMCAKCHGYAGGTAIAWNKVNAAYTAGGTIVGTPTTTSEGIILTAHQSGNSTPCVNCHPHQMVQTSCSDCHGFPPLVAGASPNFFDPVARPTVENYANGAGAHQRHKDAMGSRFLCEICHGPNPGSDGWHNEGLGTVAQNRVDIMGQTSYWDPNGVYVSTYTGIASTEGLPPLYELKAKGGNDGSAGGRCAAIACHGNPPNTAGALNWTDRMYVDAATNDPAICWWCHDSDPAIWRKADLHCYPPRT